MQQLIMDNKPSLVSQESVNYRKDAGGENSCSSCINFIIPNACSAVKGLISETGTCDIYSPIEKQAAQPDANEALMAQLFGGMNG